MMNQLQNLQNQQEQVDTTGTGENTNSMLSKEDELAALKRKVKELESQNWEEEQRQIEEEERQREEEEKQKWLNRPAFHPEPYISEAEQRRIDKEQRIAQNPSLQVITPRAIHDSIDGL